MMIDRRPSETKKQRTHIGYLLFLFIPGSFRGQSTSEPA